MKSIGVIKISSNSRVKWNIRQIAIIWIFLNNYNFSGVNIVIKDFLERRLEEAIKKIDAFEDKWAIRFDEFKERCGHDELPDKSDPYSWEVEEDFREWEAAETLKKHYSHILDRYTPWHHLLRQYLEKAKKAVL